MVLDFHSPSLMGWPASCSHLRVKTDGTHTCCRTRSCRRMQAKSGGCDETCQLHKDSWNGVTYRTQPPTAPYTHPAYYHSWWHVTPTLRLTGSNFKQFTLATSYRVQRWLYLITIKILQIYNAFNAAGNETEQIRNLHIYICEKAF